MTRRFFAPFAAVAAVAVVAGLSLGDAACGGRAPRQPAAWTPQVERIPSPAGADSAQPQLTSSGDAAVLSWLENGSSHTELEFAERTARGWSDPHVIASGDDFFANWADLPSVLRLHDRQRTLVAHWLRMNSAQSS